MAIQRNLKIYQGSTFSEIFRWKSDELSYVPITAISKSAPVAITATAHNIPNGWPCLVTNVIGMTEINSATIERTISVTDTNTITINSINSLGYSTYTSGGVLTFNTPIDLADFTARMQIRTSMDATTFLIELTTENSGITINNTDKTITVTISATDSAALDFSTGYYDLELVSLGGIVTKVYYGSVLLIKEITR